MELGGDDLPGTHKKNRALAGELGPVGLYFVC